MTARPQTTSPSTRGRFGPFRRRTALVGLALTAGLAVALWVSRAAILQTAAELLVVEDALTPSEFVVLLAGDIQERPRRVAELYKQGLAQVVLVCDVRMTEAQRARRLPSHTEILVTTLELYGVPRSAIVVLGEEYGVTSTYDEALTVKRYLDERRADGPLALVTSAFHTRRARWIFGRVFEASPLTLQMTPAPYESFDATNWWRHEDGLITVNNEYIKLAYYLVTY